MARLRVDIDSMAKLDTSLKEQIAETAESMKQMRDLVQTLDASWEGTNHDEFMESFRARKDDVKAKSLTLEQFSASLSQAVLLYRELESEVAETVSKL